MNGRIAALVVAAGLAGCGQGDGAMAVRATPVAEAAAREVKAGAARLVVPKVLHDFGEVDDTREISCSFRFENTGSGPLEILELKASCGCTTAELPRMTFGPGEGEDIEVTWKPKGIGIQAQTVDIRVKDGGAPTRLTVRARVLPKVRVEPLAADFGLVERHAQKGLRLQLTTDDPAVRIVEVAAKVPAIVAQFLPGTAQAAGAAGDLGEIDVQLLPRRELGRFNSSIAITCELPEEPGSEALRRYEMSVPVRSVVYHAVTFEPDSFYVGRVQPKGTVRYHVRLRRPDGAPFGLKLAELRDSTVPGLTVKSSEGADDQGFFQELLLIGPVGDYLGSLRGSVHVLTDIPGDEMHRLNLLGVVR